MTAQLSASRGFACCLGALALLGASGCRGSASARAGAPPAAEFVLSAGDSSYWVISSAGGIQVRGAPLGLARVDGRVVELYVVDDDRSYQDATFVGQRVYRRDLLRGDSVLLYQDDVVPHLAEQYARRHPDDERLAPDEEPSDDPLWNASAELNITAVHGPFASYEIHTDVARADAPRWHATRRGVIDLRRGGASTLAAVTGSGIPLANAERQRDAALAATVHGIMADRGEDALHRPAILPGYRLDPANFSLTTMAGAPAVAYALAGSGGGDGRGVPLAPFRITEPTWWRAVAATLPIGSSDGRRDFWRHGRYEVVVRHDGEGEGGRMFIRDSTSREWPIGRISARAERILWLDSPAIDTAWRSALSRAFNESALYDGSVRAVRFIPGLTSPRSSEAVVADLMMPHQANGLRDGAPSRSCRRLRRGHRERRASSYE